MSGWTLEFLSWMTWGYWRWEKKVWFTSTTWPQMLMFSIFFNPIWLNFPIFLGWHRPFVDELPVVRPGCPVPTPASWSAVAMSRSVVETSGRTPCSWTWRTAEVGSFGWIFWRKWGRKIFPKVFLKCGRMQWAWDFNGIGSGENGGETEDVGFANKHIPDPFWLESFETVEWNRRFSTIFPWKLTFFMGICHDRRLPQGVATASCRRVRPFAGICSKPPQWRRNWRRFQRCTFWWPGGWKMEEILGVEQVWSIFGRPIFLFLGGFVKKNEVYLKIIQLLVGLNGETNDFRRCPIIFGNNQLKSIMLREFPTSPIFRFRCVETIPSAMDCSEVNNAGVATQFPYNLTVDGVETTFQVADRGNETRNHCHFLLVSGILMGYPHYPHLMG